MIEPLAKHLEAWHDFYIVIGPGAAALTGLLFVIVSLGPHVIAGRGAAGVKAFVSPVAVHFAYVLIVSAVMIVPELPLDLLGWALAVAGLGGIVFSVWTGAHQRWRASTLPMLDWIWFVALPFVCFALLAASGVCIVKRDPWGLYGVGFTLALLVVVGIRNAWDLVLWVAQQPRPEELDPRTGGNFLPGPTTQSRRRKGR
jgi:hypothetical protein